MRKFKVEVAEPNTNNWDTTCFPEVFNADSEEEVVAMAKDLFNKCFDCTADNYIYRAIVC